MSNQEGRKALPTTWTDAKVLAWAASQLPEEAEHMANLVRSIAAGLSLVSCDNCDCVARPENLDLGDIICPECEHGVMGYPSCTETLNPLLEPTIRCYVGANVGAKEPESKEKKYVLTGMSGIVRGRTLYRIRALRDFADVKVGDLGGWLESERNLSHDGDAWVYNDASVCENAHVQDNAKVYNSASVYGMANISGDARVYGMANVSGDAQVNSSTRLTGISNIRGNAQLEVHTDEQQS